MKKAVLITGIATKCRQSVESRNNRVKINSDIYEVLGIFAFAFQSCNLILRVLYCLQRRAQQEAKLLQVKS